MHYESRAGSRCRTRKDKSARDGNVKREKESDRDPHFFSLIQVTMSYQRPGKKKEAETSGGRGKKGEEQGAPRSALTPGVVRQLCVDPLKRSKSCRCLSLPAHKGKRPVRDKNSPGQKDGRKRQPDRFHRTILI